MHTPIERLEISTQAMERLLDDISFSATDRPGETITISAAYVREQVGDLAKDADLSRFIL